MKNNLSWSQVAATFVLCLGLCTGGCQQSSEDVNTSITQSTPTPVSSLQHEPPEATAVQSNTAIATSTPTHTATFTPVPVQRKDVRITGLMIGTTVTARNEIKNPTSKYRTGDSISALVRTSGNGPEATIRLNCQDQAGNVVFEESKKITTKGEGSLVFTITAAKNFSAGEYRLVGLLDDYPEMAVSFEVSE